MASTLKEKTASGLMWGAVSNGLQQVLNLAFGIVLARRLSPADYGMVGMLTVFTATAAILQEGGFISALTNRKEVRHDDYNAVFWFCFATSLALYAVLFGCAPLIAHFYHTPELVPLSRVVFLSFVFSSLGIAPRAYLFKNLKVKETTLNSIISLFLSGVVGIVLAYNGFAYWGIALQSLTFCLSVTVFNFAFSHWRPRLSFSLQPLREMFSFSSKMVITNICATVNQHLFSVILGRCYTEREVGNFTQANRWNQMGATFVGGMINGVAQPVLAAVTNDRARRLQVFRKMLRFAAFAAFPTMFGLSCVAEELIVITITAKWLESANILRLLCVSGAFVPIVAMFTNAIVSRGRSDRFMWGTIGQIVVQLAVAYAAYPFGLNAMLCLFVGVNVAWTLVWYLLSRDDLGLTLFQLFKDLAPYALLAATLCLAAQWGLSGIENVYLRFFAKIAAVGVAYLSTLWLAGSVILHEAIGYVTKKKL